MKFDTTVLTPQNDGGDLKIWQKMVVRETKMRQISWTYEKIEFDTQKYGHNA